MKRLIFLFVPAMVVLALELGGCMKYDTLPQLEISVIDGNDKSIGGAYVALFESKSGWDSRKYPVQVWRMTDTEGKVLFTDLQEKSYFVYARFDGKDNSFGGVITSEPLQINRRDKIIIEVR